LGEQWGLELLILAVGGLDLPQQTQWVNVVPRIEVWASSELVSRFAAQVFPDEAKHGPFVQIILGALLLSCFDAGVKPCTVDAVWVEDASQLVLFRVWLLWIWVRIVRDNLS